MAHSFSSRNTSHLFTTEEGRRWSAIARVSLRKLIQLNQAGVSYQIWQCHPVTATRSFNATFLASIPSESTINGASFSNGPIPARQRWPSSITIELSL
ncbi:MAG: hypothetical protein P8Q54_04160 [Akkermansiaceae bacterium]|nr:hypothetical protein [Akkermansiaceae bacterium]